MSSYREQKNLDEKKLLALFRAYAKAGQYQLLFAHLAEISADTRNSVLQEDPALLFPQPFNDLIDPASARFSVPSELINSIIRQESSFNPEARSPADAFGLMQVIPEIAKATEKSTSLHIAQPEELYKPQINIPIGAAALQSALKRYNGQFILAVASYNASDKAVAGWMRTRFRGDPLQFIEDVPYDETKTYIKLVLRNYLFYMRLNSPTPEFKFPNVFRLSALD
jgi:soluble lytic murein transglycosylase